MMVCRSYRPRTNYSMLRRRQKVHTTFELWIRKRYGNRYDLTRDVDGFYCREAVKRMFEVWCHCHGLNVV